MLEDGKSQGQAEGAGLAHSRTASLQKCHLYRTPAVCVGGGGWKREALAED